MGFFTKDKPERNELPWIHINSVEQLHELIENTFEKPVLLFKHSTRCIVSAMVMNNFRNEWSSGDGLCRLCYLDLLAHRDVSDEIENLTGIKHESPQVIVLKGREIIYEESHSSIDIKRIESTLRKS